MKKEMEGGNRERRKMAREARDRGKKPSEIGATTGASKQRQKVPGRATTQERIDAKREGKTPSVRQTPPEAGPGSRDNDTLDRERHPRL